MDIEIVTEPERIDFAKVIAEIEEAGLSVYKIALMMHRKWDKVDRWKRGVSRPEHHEGNMLLMIHADAVPHETTRDGSIPTTYLKE